MGIALHIMQVIILYMLYQMIIIKSQKIFTPIVVTIITIIIMIVININNLTFRVFKWTVSIVNIRVV